MLRHFNASKLVSDSTAILVGGSDSAIDHGELSLWMAEGSSHLFCQINNHFWRRGKSPGTLDILYHTTLCTDGNLTPEQLHEVKLYSMFNVVGAEVDPAHHARKLLDYREENWSNLNCGAFANGEWAGQSPFGPQMDDVNELNKAYSTKLFTGNIAIYDLLHCVRVKKLYVTGMDLFGEKSRFNSNARVESHELFGNIHFLYNSYSNNKDRMVLSTTLLSALRSYGYEL